MSFLYLFTLFQKYSKNHKHFIFYVPTSAYFTVLLFSILYFLFFSFFKTLKNFEHTRESTGKVSIASRPCGFDPFSLYAIQEVSRKSKCTHFKYQFQNIHILCAVFPRSNFGAVVGDGNGLFSRFC